MIFVFLALSWFCHAEQIPSLPPDGWYVSIRLFGTTDPPESDIIRISVYQTGSVPARISVVKPDRDGDLSIHSPTFNEILDAETAHRIYAIARDMILKFEVDSAGEEKRTDGSSAEVSIETYNKSIRVTYDHSTYGQSEDFIKLKDTINKVLPNDYKL